MFFAPVLALGMWNPLLAGSPRGNARSHEGFGTIAIEWQDFVGRRLKEDFLLMRCLTHTRTPDQIFAVYADFWQKAAKDYGLEITTMSKLMIGVTTKMPTAAQSPTVEAGCSHHGKRFKRTVP